MNNENAIIINFASFVDVSSLQNLATKTFISTRFSTKTRTKTFTRWFNNISKIINKKNIYNQFFKFQFLSYFDNDEKIITNQLNVQIQRIVDIVMNNYIVKHFSQFDSSKLSNSLNSQNFVENNDNNDILT